VTPPTDQLPEPAQEAIERCLRQLRLARATELAQSCRFAEAEAALLPNGSLPGGAVELDLLARIKFHDGKPRDARRLWELALQKDPNNPAYQECLDSLPLIRIRFDTVLAYLIWTANIGGIVTLLYVLLSRK
jgi:hypothetical protein